MWLIQFNLLRIQANSKFHVKITLFWNLKLLMLSFMCICQLYFFENFAQNSTSLKNMHGTRH